MTTRSCHILRRDGVDVIVQVDARGYRVLHWGSALGELTRAMYDDLDLVGYPAVLQSGPDVSAPVTEPLGQDRGYLGTPTLSGHRAGRHWAPSFEPVDSRGDAHRLRVVCTARPALLELRTTLTLEEGGVLLVDHELVNTGTDDFALEALSASLPVPPRATELLDLAGVWCGEGQPHRRPLSPGAVVREGRSGRPDHDFPLLSAVMTPDGSFRHGEVWAMSIVWSGNHQRVVERLPDGSTRIGGGELLLPGEIVLGPGESYRSPQVAFAHSARGLDGVAERFHRWIRSWRRPTRPRPVTVNSWEAVYFDHTLADLSELATAAARIGAERFVLDDGWFHRRADDSRGLGDWWPDEDRWPDGLDPLVSHVRSLGMEFGLWVEPEMVSPDSELCRRHPDWVLRPDGYDQVPWRHQQVLDLAHDEAFAHVLATLTGLVERYDIDFLKWDHNRPLFAAGHGGRPTAHRQAGRAQELLLALRARFPRLEIEACASGGARLDLASLRAVDRVWPSDCLDPIERTRIETWVGLVIPPEMIGTDIASATSHTTGRTHSLSFRAATATLGHAGIQLDLRDLSPEESAQLASWVRYYVERRPVLHTGTVVHADHPDPHVSLRGVVSADGRRAVFVYAQLDRSATSVPVPIVLPGLRPDLVYRVVAVEPAGPPAVLQRTAPPWLAQGVRLPGRVLAEVGLAVPVLMPGNALVLDVVASGPDRLAVDHHERGE